MANPPCTPQSPGKTRVVFIDHATRVGGAQKSLLELLPRLNRHRYELHLICAQDAEWTADPALEQVARLALFAATPVLDRRRDELAGRLGATLPDALRSLSLVTRLTRALILLRPHIVHTNTLKAHVLGGLAARLARRPLVWHVRDILEPGPARDWLLRVARIVRPRIIAISSAVAQQFAGTGLPTVLIHNGIDLDQFSPGPDACGVRQELGLSDDDQVLCVVGRLTPWKGHRELLAALAQIAPRYPRVTLLVVGEVAFWEDSYGEELRAYARQLGLEQRVRWLGFRKDVPAILRACDVCVLPSVNEPFGRVLIEAMAVGKPVIATRSGGVPEIVAHGETGLLVNPDDPEDLAAGLARLLGDPHTAAEMGRRGLVRAREHFDVRRVACMVEQLYDSIACGA